MALISQMYNVGGGSGGNNTSLPTPPKKADRNTADISATVPAGITTGWNGRFSYTYYHWDVRSVVPNCRFGISGNSAWDSSAVMALRNDSTGTTVWTKAYSTLGSYGPQACCFDMTNGFFYVFTTTNTELRLWKIRLSDGVATQVATDAGTKCPNYGYSVAYPGAMLARFISPDTIELVYYRKGSSPHLCYRTTVNVTTGVFSVATEFNAVGYLAPSEAWAFGSQSYGSGGGVAMNASVQYVTADGKISVAFTPSRLTDTPIASTATDGGDRGSIRTYIITRGLGRCSISVVDPGYNTPYRHDNNLYAAQEQFIATDNQGALAMMASRTQYILGWDGRFEFYDAVDFDRWLTEIADEAGLPNGSFW